MYITLKWVTQQTHVENKRSYGLIRIKEKCMNILFIQGVSRYGGAHRSLFVAMKLLKGKNFNPILVTSRENRLTEECKSENIKFYTFFIGMWRKVKSWPFFPITIYKLVKVIKKEKIDIIHCNTLWDTPYGLTLKLITGKPVITHLRGTHNRNLLKKYYVKHADTIIGVSQSTNKYLSDIEVKKVKIVYNPIENLEEKENISKKTTKTLIISIIGRIDPHKRQLDFIEKIFVKLSNIIKAKLYIVGAASKKDKHIENRIKEYEKLFRNKIIFTGEVKNVFEYYNLSDIIIISSDRSIMEGLPRVAIEAGISKKFVMATDSGGTKELIDRKTGIIVEDLNLLFEPLKEALINPKVRLTYGLNLNKRTNRICSQEKFLKEISKIYCSKKCIQA
jgi:glycosyltransferase involved in cell wall biosynthesis